MSEQLSKLSEVSMVSANFGNGLAYREILMDWFKFLGGKPGEVIVVDGGSDRETQKVYWELYQEGLIDKLQIIASHHQDNDKDRCFIQEYTAGAIASKPYVLWFKIDTLPYREGHDGWLEEAIDYLERDEIFAVGGGFNRSFPHLDAWAGWYFIQACTINFSLMKHSTFVAVMQEFAGEYIASRFEGTHQFGRFLLEEAFSAYMEAHNQYTLCKMEDPSWTVFHTNAQDEYLQEVREKYLAREDVKNFMNAALAKDISQFLYYGKPPVKSSMIQKMRMALGETKVGDFWRELKKSLVLGKSELNP
ncbi:glycosyltransferase family A protein [Microcoleus sp. Pol14C6]|uniref:glycosyltransferase family A protein n=1 Tax=unclassified Microcoleus TaxID=2642155 RepID=UPI002FD06775